MKIVRDVGTSTWPDCGDLDLSWSKRGHPAPTLRVTDSTEETQFLKNILEVTERHIVLLASVLCLYWLCRRNEVVLNICFYMSMLMENNKSMENFNKFIIEKLH